MSHTDEALLGSCPSLSYRSSLPHHEKYASQPLVKGGPGKCETTVDQCVSVRCSGGMLLRIAMAMLFAIFLMNIILMNFVSSTENSGILGMVTGAGLGFFSQSDPSLSTSPFSGVLQNNQDASLCLILPTVLKKGKTYKASNTNKVLRPKQVPTIVKCDVHSKSHEVVAVPAREPIETGAFLRHIESMQSKLGTCLSAALNKDGDGVFLSIVSCTSVAPQWLFTKSKQIVLFDSRLIPSLTKSKLDIRHLDKEPPKIIVAAEESLNGEQSFNASRAAVHEQPSPLLCLELNAVDKSIILAPCKLSADHFIAAQQWNFRSTKNTNKLLHDRAFAKYDFNEFRSRELGPIRQSGWPNSRSSQCSVMDRKSGVYLERTSVIICFVNEEWFALMRTINSVIDLSPPELLEEIILIDDGSDAPDMGKPLEQAIRAHPAYHLLKLYRTGSRTGLIRARLFGAERAEASILTFLDSHIEVNVGWLEPLIARVSEDATRVVAPVISVINQDSIENQFSVSTSNVAYGVVDWDLIFHWAYAQSRAPPEVNVHRQRAVDAFEAPTMAGGLFTVDRDFFYSIGSYDDGMAGWGGENIEISFRIWMCGGSLEVVPCSIVGHIFRQRNPSPFPGSNINTIFRHNLVRVAEVWMDDFKHIYFQKALIHASAINHDEKLLARHELRKQLQCHSFQWYLDTVFPSLFAPKNDFVLYHGSLYQKSSYIDMKSATNSDDINYCIQALSSDPAPGSALLLKVCGGHLEEKFYVGTAGQIVLHGWPGQTLCITATGEDKSPTLNVCHGHHASAPSLLSASESAEQNKVPVVSALQKWTATPYIGRADSFNGFLVLRNVHTGLCLATSAGGTLKSFFMRLTLRPCPAPEDSNDAYNSYVYDAEQEGSVDNDKILWLLDKEWGTNDHSAADSAIMQASAKRRNPPLPNQRHYDSDGKLDCSENTIENAINGWPVDITGSNVHASLDLCAIACDATEMCNSFSFNPAIGDCWLKRRCGKPQQTCENFDGYQTYFATDVICPQKETESKINEGIKIRAQTK